MSDVKIKHEAMLTRADAARWLADLAEALDGDDKATIALARSTVELEVPRQVRCEAEIEVDGDEVEFEFEMTWSTAETHPPGSPDGA